MSSTGGVFSVGKVNLVGWPFDATASANLPALAVLRLALCHAAIDRRSRDRG